METAKDGPQTVDDVSVESEMLAMSTINKAFGSLDGDAQKRVHAWISSRLGIGTVGRASSLRSETAEDVALLEREVSVPAGKPGVYQYPAELFDAVRPKTDVEKALVLAYWFQVCQSQPSFTSRQVNDELKHIGYGVGNITRALELLCTAKPALVIQLEKAGKTQQAQKKFKMTHEGVKKVQQMLTGAGARNDQ
jgi:hypothetical protein